MENLGLLRKIVWSFLPENKSDFDDLLQEACLEYFNCLKDYDSSRGKITTFVWWRVSSQLKNVLQDQRKERERLLPIDVILEKETIEDTFLEALTKEALLIANVVLSSPSAFIDRTPIEIKKQLKKILRKEGVSVKQITYGIKSLQIACS